MRAEIGDIWRRIEAARFGEAEELCRQLLAEGDAPSEVEFALAVARFRQGDIEGALAHIENVLSRTPANLSALGLGARILMDLGRYEPAMEYGRRAYELRPDEGPMLLHQIAGRGSLAMNRPISALRAFKALIELNPRQPVGYLGAADAYLALGSTFDACEMLTEAAAVAPIKGTLLKLGSLQLKLGLPDRALRSAERVLAQEPDDSHANALAGQSLVELGQIEQADQYWGRARANLASQDWVELRHGSSLAMMGHFKLAEAHLRKAIEARPEQGAAYKMLFANRKAVQSDHPTVQRMAWHFENSAMTDEERAALAFAVGKASDDLGEPETAFRYYDLGHEIQLRQLGEQGLFKLERMREQFEAQRALFSAPTTEARDRDASEPIFVIGMMRSGTTLTEQILAAHSQVVGAGELDFWSASEPLCIDRSQPKFDPEVAEDRRSAYRRLLNEFGGDGRRVVDKFPGNLNVVGMIHRIFPNAHIIHLRRKPIDVAVSLWATHSNPFSPFTTTRRGIVDAIRQSIDQADHWRRVLPTNRFLDIRYEDLVSNPET